jgi:hypothetical protein
VFTHKVLAEVAAMVVLPLEKLLWVVAVVTVVMAQPHMLRIADQFIRVVLQSPQVALVLTSPLHQIRMAAPSEFLRNLSEAGVV